jgi:integrase
MIRKRSDIDKISVRKAIEPRHEPYWGAPLGKGQVLGFRKIAATTGTWIARMRDESGRKVYRALGAALVPSGSGTPTLDYEQARADALKWFKGQDAGIEDDRVTVGDACRAYVAERRKSKSEACAHDAAVRFERSIYGRKEGERPKAKAIAPNAIAAVPMAKLRAERIREWRDGLGLAPGATNRTLTALKAALNLAVHDRHASAELTMELRRVKPLPGGKKRRDLYLDLKQRRALLKAAKGAAHDLIEGVALTGARAGELVKATVSQFDARSKSMTFITGKGNDGPRSRTVPLSARAVKLFSKLAEGKAPADRLFVRDDGTPWGHSDWDEPVRDAAKAAKLPTEPKTGVCLYTLRHSWITTALTKGMSTLDVARLAGTSIMMIEKNYGHLVASAARERLASVVML